ncbi:MAG: hypothetical protein IE916_00530 [Epsilonproteobacteria bacterium]|nr:hypothetical protein [Campylobacterota bacterium]
MPTKTQENITPAPQVITMISYSSKDDDEVLDLPTLEQFKLQAKLIKLIAGNSLKSSNAHHLLAKRYGYNSWQIIKPVIEKNDALRNLRKTENEEAIDNKRIEIIRENDKIIRQHEIEGKEKEFDVSKLKTIEIVIPESKKGNLLWKYVLDAFLNNIIPIVTEHRKTHGFDNHSHGTNQTETERNGYKILLVLMEFAGSEYNYHELLRACVQMHFVLIPANPELQRPSRNEHYFYYKQRGIIKTLLDKNVDNIASVLSERVSNLLSVLIGGDIDAFKNHKLGESVDKSIMSEEGKEEQKALERRFKIAMESGKMLELCNIYNKKTQRG